MKGSPSCPESLNSGHEFSENAVEFLVGRLAAAASACASYSSKNYYPEKQDQSEIAVRCMDKSSHDGR